MRPTIFVAPAAATLWLMALAAPAGAQTHKMRPGLWEHSVTMKSQSGQMEAAMAQAQKSLAAMPPAQRQQMEQMLAQRGIGLGAQGQSVRVCISPEQAELDRLPSQDGCTQEVRRTGPDTLAMKFSCTAPKGQAPTSGEGTLTFSGPTAYHGQFKMNTANAQGKPEQIDMAQTGRWLAADCGAIKSLR